MVRFQDTFGAAAAAIEGDNLDVTSQQTLAEVADIAKPTGESKKPATPAHVHSELDDGLSMGQKLLFLGVLIGLCALFLRSRGGADGFKVKSMA